MEGRGNIVTMREITKEGDSPVEQGDTKEEVQQERNTMGKQVGNGRSPHKKEQKRSKDDILWR